MWQVKMVSGLIIPVPQHLNCQYESIRRYGISAVIERINRVQKFKDAIADGDSIGCVIDPRGNEITQF